MGSARLADAVRRAFAPVRRYSAAVWGRDRAQLGRRGSLGTRVGRIVTLSARGLLTHRLSLQAAALAYYTLFSIVPVLVVALWVLKLFHLIHYLMPDVPAPTEASAEATAEGMHLPEANVMLRSALRTILSAVDRAGKLQAGIVGLAALGYGVLRQIIHVESALKTIAGQSALRPRYVRWLGYLALAALPPALLIMSGLLRVIARLPAGAKLTRAVSWLLDTVPQLKSAVSVGIGLGIVCVALAIFYASSARARIAPHSTIVGAAVGAVLLGIVLLVFARLQIGVSRTGALQSGMAVIPVFLLWSYFSWLVILLGAEVAVAHELDCILVHGVRAWRLDPYDEQVAGVQIMVDVTQQALSPRAGADADTTVYGLARRLRLLPESVREVAGRLLNAGLLRNDDGDDYRLACDPDRMGLRDVVGAVIGRPDDVGRARGGRRTGPTLRELVERETSPAEGNGD